jgi:hypothetical protein
MATDLNAWHRAVGSASDDLQRTLARHRAQLAGIYPGPAAADQKRREIAASYVAAAGKVAAQKRADTDAIDRAGQQAEELAFRPPASERADPAAVMAYRDARDRARQLRKPAEAHALLDEAQSAGDTSLARAVAHHSYRQGWHDVTVKWAQAQPPAVMAHLNDAAEGANLRGPAGNMARSMAYHVRVPPELRGLSEAQIRQLAA